MNEYNQLVKCCFWIEDLIQTLIMRYTHNSICKVFTYMLSLTGPF